MADDVVGDQRDDLGGDPVRADRRHAHRRGGDDRQHGASRVSSTTTSAETRRSSSSSRSGSRSGWPRRPRGAPTPNWSRRRGWRRRTRSGSGCRARYTTAPSRCWRWCPAAVAKSAARQRNWPSWRGSRSARCAGWSARPMPSRGRARLTDVGALLRRRASDRVSVSVPADPVLLDAGVADRAVRRGRERAGQRRRARRARRPRLRAARGSGRLGHGEHPRRRRRDRGRPAGGSGRRGPRRRRQIDCGTDELARWQREAEHRAGMRDGMGADGTPTVMVVDDHPIWRDAVARDLAEDGFNVVATADGVAVGPQAGRGRAAGRRGDGHAAARRRRRAGDRRGAHGVAGVEDPGALGLRRARRRAGGREGRRHRLSGQECVEARTRRRGAGDRRGPCGVHPGPGRAGAGGVPAHRARWTGLPGLRRRA